MKQMCKKKKRLLTLSLGVYNQSFSSGLALSLNPLFHIRSNPFLPLVQFLSLVQPCVFRFFSPLQQNVLSGGENAYKTKFKNLPPAKCVKNDKCLCHKSLNLKTTFIGCCGLSVCTL